MNIDYQHAGLPSCNIFRNFNQFLKAKSGGNQTKQVKKKLVITLIIMTTFFKNSTTGPSPKKWNHYRISEIPVSLSTKLPLKQKFLNFLTEFAQREHFLCETRKFSK